MRTLSSLVAVVIVATIASACSTADSNDGGEGTTTSIGVGATTTTTPTQPTTTAAAGAPASIRDMRGDLGIGTVTLEQSTEGGSHPLLEWQPVDGATAYWLILRDSSGRAYWAWSGTETSVRVGGGDRTELNQTAALHEVMTWSVAALDAAGQLLAVSDLTTVSP